MKVTAESAFKPNPSRGEAKQDATSRVAREIIDLEAAQRTSKTERLKAERLAREAEAAAAAPPPKKTRTRRSG